MPRLRMARDTSPLWGSIVKKMRKFGCGRTDLTCPSASIPRSLTASTPPGSSTLFSRSSTVGLQKFTLSISSQSPASIAWINNPSIHSKHPLSDLLSTCASSASAHRRLSGVQFGGRPSYVITAKKCL